MLMLVNRPRLMGEYRNSVVQNAVAWSTTVIMILLTVALIWTSLAA
jgi:Mn2+/Fe2+ NRAMP family transporter